VGKGGDDGLRRKALLMVPGSAFRSSRWGWKKEGKPVSTGQRRLYLLCCSKRYFVLLI
jgi:hypothetical protein